VGIYSFIVCVDLKLLLFLGKPLRVRAPDGSDPQVVCFHAGSDTPVNSEQTELNSALWKYLAHTAGHDLKVLFDYLLDDDEGDEPWCDIGGDSCWDIPFHTYLMGWDQRQQDAMATGATGSSAWLVCRSSQIGLALGRVLRDNSGTIIGFRRDGSHAPGNHGHPGLSKALWRFLAETNGHTLSVVVGGEPSGLQIVGADIAIEDYLAGWDG
jgi:hypothetical protein